MCAHPKWTCAHPRSLTCASLTHHGEEIVEKCVRQGPNSDGMRADLPRDTDDLKRDIYPHPASKRAHARAGHTYTQAAEGISQGRRNAVPPDTPRILSKKTCHERILAKYRFARPLNSEGQTKEAKCVTTRISTLPHTSKIRDSSTTSCWPPHKPERAENNPSVNNPPCVQANPPTNFRFAQPWCVRKLFFIYPHPPGYKFSPAERSLE